MLIQYVEKRFSKSSAEVIERANALIADYAAQGLALTLRQLYYRFVAAGLLPNTQQSYKRLGSIVNDARLAGEMSWVAIEDRGRNLVSLTHWDDPAEIVKACASSFHVDQWEGQEYRVEVWVEKQALEAVVGQACEPLDCAYFACKGYTSQSEMWRAAMRLERYADAGQQPVIIHLGDHDPSGIDMTRDIIERLNELFGIHVEVERIALNMDQVEEYDPPPNPAKLTDSRAEGYVAEYGSSSWELDALEPAVLRDLIRDSIGRYLDLDLFDAREEEENEHKKLLRAASKRWDDVVDFLKEGGE